MDDIVAKPKTGVTAAEMERRRKIVREVEANARLEGQFSGLESNKIFEAFVLGEIELADIIPRLKSLHRLC